MVYKNLLLLIGKRSKNKRSVHFATAEDEEAGDSSSSSRAKSVQQKLRQLAGNDNVSWFFEYVFVTSL